MHILLNSNRFAEVHAINLTICSIQCASTVLVWSNNHSMTLLPLMLIRTEIMEDGQRKRHLDERGIRGTMQQHQAAILFETCQRGQMRPCQ